jgi:hypothetical protein
MRLLLRSGRPDLNRGPPVPQTGALTRLRHAPCDTECSRGRLAPRVSRRRADLHASIRAAGSFRARRLHGPRRRETPDWRESARGCRSGPGSGSCRSSRCKRRSNWRVPSPVSLPEPETEHPEFLEGPLPRRRERRQYFRPATTAAQIAAANVLPRWSSVQGRRTARWRRCRSAAVPRPGGALQVRGLNEHGHQIALRLAVRPALGVRVEHVEILIVVERLFHASPSSRDGSHS